MARPGRKPRPTALKILRGERADRINHQEPAPPAGPVPPPEWLQGDGLVVWSQIAPQLLATGVLTVIDADALARYCSLVVQWRKHLGIVERGGDVLIMRDETGKVRYTQVAPSATLVNKYGAALLRLESEFGMTPAARSAIRVGQQPDASDPLQSFLARHDARA